MDDFDKPINFLNDNEDYVWTSSYSLIVHTILWEI